MRTQSLATSLILVAAGLLVPTVADAATPVAATCGAVLTTDAYLNADVSCPGQRGVTVSGNITIDLRNHVLRGSGGIGIAILDGYSAQVRNGTVRGWGAGIGTVDAGDQPGAASARVKNVTLDSDGSGVSMGTFDTVVLENSRFLNNGTGISGSGSDATSVTRPS